MLRINDVTQIWLGIQGENQARNIEIDVSDWVEDFPDAGFSVWMTAPGGTVPQATGASYVTAEQKIVWSPSSTDTYVAGEGEAEIRLSEGNVIKKTKKIRVGISGSVTGGGSALGPDWQAYINEADRIRGLAVAAQLAAEQAQDAAENVAEHPPYINLGTYRWMVWNRTAGAYEDSGISAQGVPGPAGSQGPQGIQGERGPQGPQGIQGIQGPVGQAGQQGPQGPAGERGEDFEIRKTYASIAQMEADYDTQDVDFEEFVIIQTVQGQVDNGKVYKKGMAAWEFIVQMAGVEGPAGPTGPQGPQGIQGIQGERGETGSQGPRGEQGIQGVPGPGVPAGGTAGQYLRKNSGTDYDGDWESPVNGLTETGSGKVLDARQGKVLDDRASAMQDAIAIVADGNTHAAISAGKFVYVKNHASLAEGLYKATAAIGTNAALTTSNLTADGSGGLNDLQGQVTTLNSNVNTNVNINSLFTKGPNENGTPTGRKCGKLVLFSFIGERRTHTENEVIFTIASEIRPVADLKFNASIDGVSVILNLSASTGECTIFLINGQGSVNSRLYCTFTYICA